MKKSITSLSLFITVALLLVSGCTNKKEDQKVLVTSDTEIGVITDKAITGMETQEVYSDNPDLGIYMLDDGIIPDFLLGDTDLRGSDSARAHIRDHSVIACLRGLNLSESQKTAIEKELRRYSACKDKAVSRAKEIYHDLQVKYKTSYTRLYNALINGTLSREKFKEAVAGLRAAFKKELRALQIREKLDDAFTTCFRKFLTGLQPILAERQWNAFVACCKQG